MLNKICAYHKCSKYFMPKRKGQRFCSTQCSINNCRTKKRRTVKQELVNYKGGECGKCGYNKCIDALEFHHTNPSEKEFNLSRNAHIRTLEEFKKEADKCILLCANCHREEHNKDNGFSHTVEKEQHTNNCKVCGKSCKNKLCSHLCSNIFNRKINRPSKEQLLSEIKELGYCGTGRKYNVSDNAIRKWLKNY